MVIGLSERSRRQSFSGFMVEFVGIALHINVLSLHSLLHYFINH